MKYEILNDYFTKLYFINLERRPDRHQQCLNEFRKIKANAERVIGIDGKKLFTSLMKPGAYGLLLTHVNIFRNAITNNYDSIAIFEDDVTFVDNFNDIFNERMKSLPEDWDLLYIGGNHILHVPGFKLITGDKDFKVTKENYKTLNYELCKTPCTYCAHALAIRSTIYQRILDTIKQRPTQPIDNIYYALQQEGCNAYTFLPSLATQRASFSDIEGYNVNYGSMPFVNF